MVEPFGLFEIELGSALVHAFEGELLYHLFEGENILFAAVIPSEHGKHIEKCFGQETHLAEAFCRLACIGVFPVHCKYGKTQPVSIPLAQFTVAIGFEDEWKVCPAGHLIFSEQVSPQ